MDRVVSLSFFLMSEVWSLMFPVSGLQSLVSGLALHGA